MFKDEGKSWRQLVVEVCENAPSLVGANRFTYMKLNRSFVASSWNASICVWLYIPANSEMAAFRSSAERIAHIQIQHVCPRTAVLNERHFWEEQFACT